MMMSELYICFSCIIEVVIRFAKKTTTTNKQTKHTEQEYTYTNISIDILIQIFGDALFMIDYNQIIMICAYN